MKLAQQAGTIELSFPKETHQLGTFHSAECISAHRVAAVVLLADIISFSVSGIAPALLYNDISAAALTHKLLVISVGIPLFLLASQATNSYDTKKIFAIKRMLISAVLALLITFIVLMVIGVATKSSEEYSRIWFFSWLSLSLLLISFVRATLLALTETKLTKGACLQRALIVSCGDSPLSSEELALETRNRIRAVGAISSPDLASLPDLRPYLRQLNPEVVILSVPLSEIEVAMQTLKPLSHYPVEVLVLPQASPVLQRAIRLRRLGTRTLLQVAEPPLADWDLVIKRIEDIVVASAALLLTSPLLILTALAIKFESTGPALFKQMREGYNGDLIEVWKFRSMFVEMSDPEASCQTSKRDPRVTRVGRLIRKTSIDELPQFWNVLRGEMSVVGPRPHALGTSAEGKTLSAIVEEYAARRRVKPGITGWAQINGARGELCSQEQVQRRVDLDLHYIENWSLMLDLKIIVMTTARALHDADAY